MAAENYHRRVSERSTGALAELRRAAGVTQEELAERCGMSARGISAIECGQVRRPHRRSLLAIAAALGLAAADRDRLLGHYGRCPAGPADPAPATAAEPAGPAPTIEGLADVAPVGWPPAQLPAATASFVGRRAETARLDALLTGLGAAMTIVAVDGAGGLGKSTLALQWAHRVRHLFPDGQLYANLRGYGPTPPADPTAVLARFLTALGIPAARLPADLETRSALLRSRLADRRVLVVLDDARTADQVRPLLPGSPGCLVLVTSRNRLVGLSVHEGAHRVPLGPLPGAEARALLGRFVQPDRLDGEQAAVARILHECAGLPLAISLVGELASGGRSLPEVAAGLADQRTRLQLLDRSADETDRPVSLRAVFSWSYLALGAPAARLFRLLALHPGPDFDAAAAAALVDESPAGIGALLTVLTGGHLLEERAGGRYDLHELLRSYAAELCRRDDPEPARRAAQGRLLDHYLRTAAAADHRLDPYGGSPVPADADRFGELADAMRWLAAERTNLLAVARSAAARGEDDRVCRLSETLWRYLHQVAAHEDAVVLHGEALAAARRLGDRGREATALTLLGTARHRLGDNEQALALLERALALGAELDDPMIGARALDYLGLVRASVGDLPGAVEAHQQALDRYRRIGHRAGEAQTVNNLGLVCWRSDRSEEALRHFTRARELARAVGDAATEAGSTNNIGLILRGLGRYEQARDHFEQALAQARDLGHREGEGFATCNLGIVSALLGEHAAAQRYQREALAIARSTGMRELEVSVLNQLGRLAELTGDPAEAVELHTRALRLGERIDEAHGRAVALDGLGRAYRALGDRAAARRHFEQALAARPGLRPVEADEVRALLTGLG
ncbi:hypothetical protein NUM_23380 [Actinocatenispora comari]|uniref:HTH cro/C1-type domain-containing protein n=1 Tax=Actinocatenispora comari TaxID=2807577 RepID=A0A8J4EMW0_9ACTN|nr:hypothetical protein NUM_23380 [Actinocatenispora comari]